LAGTGPADWVAPDFDLTDFTLPSNLPVSLPAELAHDRPISSRRRPSRQRRDRGGDSQFYPHLTLSASLTQAAAGPGSLLEAGSTLWSIAAGLAGPLFHGGALEADRRAAVDNYKASLASYQRTVIKSLGQVADVLQSINHDAEECSAQDHALNARSEPAVEPGRLSGR
jgi:outer membrane protein TolC